MFVFIGLCIFLVAGEGTAPSLQVVSSIMRTQTFRGAVIGFKLASLFAYGRAGKEECMCRLPLSSRRTLPLKLRIYKTFCGGLSMHF